MPVPAAETAASYERLHTALLEDAHLGYEDFAAYVDGATRGVDRERIESHAQGCAECAAEVLAYRELRRQIESEQADTRAATKAPSMEWLARLFAGPAWRMSWVVAATAACVLAILWLRKPTERASGPEIAEQRYPQRAEPRPDQTATLLDGGRTLYITATGAVSGIDDLPVAWRRHMEAAVGGHLDARVYPELRRRASTLLSTDTVSNQLATLVTPLDVVVESTTPTFAWKGQPANEYRVEVFDEQFQSVTASDWIKGNEWRPSPPLARGKLYAWQLVIRRDGGEMRIPAPPAPEARFRVISEAEAHELDQARDSYPDFRLLHAVLYARAGLIAQSRAELSQLQTDNPQSEAVVKLRSSLNARNARQRRVPTVTKPAQ